MRIWGRVGLGGIAVLASSLFITVPAGAASSHPGGVSDTCPEALAGAPGGGLTGKDEGWFLEDTPYGDFEPAGVGITHLSVEGISLMRG